MNSNLLDFHFNLLSIDHTITPSKANEFVAFQSFTISWHLTRGYKTKVITLSSKRSTITSNEEKNMIMSRKAKEKYRGMFKIQKSGDKTSSGEVGLDIRTHASPKVRQDQVSGGVSVLCLHAAPVAYVLLEPCTTFSPYWSLKEHSGAVDTCTWHSDFPGHWGWRWCSSSPKYI